MLRMNTALNGNKQIWQFPNLECPELDLPEMDRFHMPEKEIRWVKTNGKEKRGFGGMTGGT